MRASTVLLIGLAAVGGRASTVYTNPPFEHFSVILERMPFGVPPPPPPSPPPQAPEPETNAQMDAFLKQHRLCALTRTPQGIGVGFIETTGDQPRTYFLLVGDTLDGYRVYAADYQSETVIMEKDGERFTLALDGSALPAERRQNAEPERSTRVAAAGRRRSTEPTASDAAERASYVERLRQRREEARQRREAQEAQQQASREAEVERLTGEALQRHLREYNLQLIRARGEMGPPLPMELTPEEDAQLVEEGVLPPSE